MEKQSPQYRIVTSFEELHKALCVRNIVFVEGQNCNYAEEFDKFDFCSTHFLGTMGDEPIAAARIRFLKDSVIKLERIAVREQYRGQGIGKQFFRFILDYAESLNYKKLLMHAQAHLVDFYGEFGFKAHGAKFLEANIEHYRMEK